MTLTPFKGRCHTCGHDHDAEMNLVRDVLDICQQVKHEAAQPSLKLIGYMSPQQVPLIVDPLDSYGTYIPMRKTPQGLFTLPLYTLDSGEREGKQ